MPVWVCTGRTHFLFLVSISPCFRSTRAVSVMDTKCSIIWVPIKFLDVLFSQSGVDIQSQTAYELAVQGLIKPANSKIPILYGIKCIHFEPPNFTIGMCSMQFRYYIPNKVHEYVYSQYTYFVYIFGEHLPSPRYTCMMVYHFPVINMKCCGFVLHCRSAFSKVTKLYLT